MLISGTDLAKRTRADVKHAIQATRAAHPSFCPTLVIIQVGAQSASSTYVRGKLRAAAECGINASHVQLPAGASEAEIRHHVRQLNDDPAVHGILVQLPLGDHIGADAERRVTEEVSPSKDVDGFHALNIGKLSSKAANPLFAPCTPAACIKLLEQAGLTDLSGLTATVIGRSDIVGNPVTSLLRSRNCTVTQVHSRTRDLPSHLRTADIVIAALGKPEFVKGAWLKPGAVVIDVGINYVPDASKKSGRRLVGDVDFASALSVAGAITPVPGGVGPMTIACLMENALIAAQTRVAQGTYTRRGVATPNPLQRVLSPVPPDMEVARAQRPRAIADVAHDIGIRTSELELHGAHKAKVSPAVLDRLQRRTNGKYIVVAGITPTPLGEGKSTTTLGLVQALGAHLGRPAFACIRQPSQGPTFGIKGGAAGGGYAQVIPMDEFNLHLTGDIHAVMAANNLLAAAIDARMFHEATQQDGPLYDRLVPRQHGSGSDNDSGRRRAFAPAMLTRLRKLGISKTDPDALTPDERRRFARLDIDPATVTWRRVVDTNDRHLRGVTVGQAATERGLTRATAFDIAVASECMAVLALARDLPDLRARLGRIVVAADRAGMPVTADDIGCAGALAVLMKDALSPTLMQSLEGTPVFVHAGPFANIAHGNSSILADAIALKLAGSDPASDAAVDTNADDVGYVVTEAGFGADIGLEKFCNIKCRTSGLAPDAVVLVATVRALKAHGGAPPVAPGQPLPPAYTREDIAATRAGCATNLAKHIENVKAHGLPVIVAINRFASDTPAELAAVQHEALAAGADAAVPTSHYEHGGAGALDLARTLVETLAHHPSRRPASVPSSAPASAPVSAPTPGFRYLYDVRAPVADKIRTIATQMYGADDVELSAEAVAQIDTYTRQGFAHLPICMAKTHLSLSHDPQRKGRPTGFTLPIRAVRLAAGAGFLTPLVGAIQTMPGLATRPGFYDIDLDEHGNVYGLS